jgi:hypothetical protein
MYLKDYYKTLAVEPSATLPEIKKAYRKLAQQYHPDKTADNPHSAALFTEIKEAYEVLTNPGKKYNYLQQRWYNRATGNNKTHQLITPVNILKQVLEFEQYTAQLDVFRMDKESIFEYLDVLLKAETVGKIIQFNDPEINHQIVLTVLKPLQFLPVAKAILLKERLLTLALSNTQTEELIHARLLEIQKKEQWKNMEWLFVFLLTAAICWLIWYGAN